MSSADRSSLTSYSVEFPLSGDVPALLPEVEVRQSQMSHDVAVVSLANRLDNLQRGFRTGAPVRIRWGNRWGDSQFVGYVHNVQPHFGSDRFSTKVVCVGASFPMVTVRQRTFSNTTADLVVRQVAAEHGLLAVAEPHPRVYETVPQPTISDWALLMRLAHETGYVLRAEQTRVMFMSRRRVEQETRPMAQTMAMTTSPSNTMSSASSVFSFDPILADYLPERGVSDTRKQVRALDPSTGDYLVLDAGLDRQGGLFTKPVDVVANSVSAALARLDSAVEASRFVHRARVRSVGSPPTAPERMVYLAGVPEPYDGYWTVLSVTHRIRSLTDYTMEMEVGSDALRSGEPGPTAGLSEEMRYSINARDVASYRTLRVRNSDSVLDSRAPDLEGDVGRALTRAAWRSATLTAV